MLLKLTRGGSNRHRIYPNCSALSPQICPLCAPPPQKKAGLVPEVDQEERRFRHRLEPGEPRRRGLPRQTS
jgi:hypothetical protein